MNKSDSERIASLLDKMGFKKTSKENEADLFVINMCSVRQTAVDRVYGKIRNLAKLKVKTILTGCVLKKDKTKLAKKFDFILNIKDLPKWPQIINPHISGGREKSEDIILTEKKEEEGYLDVKAKPTNKFSAFIPISNGCSNCCAYCAVPFTRGPLICRSVEKILEEIETAVQNGAKEIWLLGQNVNHYNSRICTNMSANIANSGKFAPKSVNIREVNFPKLLKMINNIPGKFWIRFTSPNPADFSDQLIKTMAKCEKITPYLNLPLQSGDDKILKKMNRHYNVSGYKNLVEKIRKKIPNISLSTDIIVGFPGETKKQFENTAKLMEKIKFDMAYIAKYSPRPKTAAAQLKDNVSSKEKERREKILTEILKKTALENNKKQIGWTVDVLANNYKNGFLTGKSSHYKTVKFQGDKSLIGNFVKVKITDALPWGLRGKLL
jgi:tRNA-2-methylthio-N6-dimethylallyladenosine synthase